MSMPSGNGRGRGRGPGGERWLSDHRGRRGESWSQRRWGQARNPSMRNGRTLSLCKHECHFAAGGRGRSSARARKATRRLFLPSRPLLFRQHFDPFTNTAPDHLPPLPAYPNPSVCLRTRSRMTSELRSRKTGAVGAPHENGNGSATPPATVSRGESLPAFREL